MPNGGHLPRTDGPRPGGGHPPRREPHQPQAKEQAQAASVPVMPRDTRSVLVVENAGVNIQPAESRSLIFDRLANPSLKEEPRRKFFENHKGRFSADSLNLFRNRRMAFLRDRAGAKGAFELELKGRLVLNASGGVMENAGLCLDRFSNLPYIPGSAVKGCARRAALAYLREWVESGTKPEGMDGAPTYHTPEDLFMDITLIFGWVDQDWKDGQDFAWAWGKNAWRTKRNELAERLLKTLGRPLREKPEPWKQLPSFEGVVGFLSAWPQSSPQTDIELDVVTCHHKNYYEGKQGFESAPDTEDPVPVVFPAVAPGHVFLFGVHPIRRPLPSPVNAMELAAKARAWLKLGLQVFGIGAKTNAGYGWFDCSDDVQNAATREQAEVEGRRETDEEAAAEARAEKERLEKLPPHEKFKAEYGKLADEPFATQAKKFHEMTEDQRKGFVLALKERRETAKRWAKRKPDLINPWREYAQKLQPPIELS